MLSIAIRHTACALRKEIITLRHIFSYFFYMITKKLIVPLINEKILSQAEHCYIASAAITDAGFEMIRSRISPKCKMDIVASLDGLTSPNVLKQINNHYAGRITLNVFTRNVLHANVYVFYLPYRKAVAFVGSGNFSLEGLKDQEELFWKITDAKEIESLMSWFTSFFEFGIPLTERLIQEYEQIYPRMKQREITSRQQKQQFMVASNLNWEGIKFKNQFFKKEDFQIFSAANASFDNAAIRLARMEVQSKLLQLKDSLSAQMDSYKLDLDRSTTSTVDAVEPANHPEQIISAMWISYTDNEQKYFSHQSTIQAGISNVNFSIRLVVLGAHNKRQERDHFKTQWQIESYRAAFFGALSRLTGYTFEIAGVKKPVESFLNEQALTEFVKTDYGMHFNVIIEKTFSPGDNAISNDNIVSTILGEFKMLVPFN
jgi:hypothetical protein